MFFLIYNLNTPYLVNCLLLDERLFFPSPIFRALPWPLQVDLQFPLYKSMEMILRYFSLPLCLHTLTSIATSYSISLYCCFIFFLPFESQSRWLDWWARGSRRLIVNTPNNLGLGKINSFCASPIIVLPSSYMAKVTPSYEKSPLLVMLSILSPFLKENKGAKTWTK